MTVRHVDLIQSSAGKPHAVVHERGSESQNRSEVNTSRHLKISAVVQLICSPAGLGRKAAADAKCQEVLLRLRFHRGAQKKHSHSEAAYDQIRSKYTISLHHTK